MLCSKKKYGQFMTTNYEIILRNLTIPKKTKSIVEPFAGNGDLIQFIKNFPNITIENITIECYDIEPKHDYIIRRDTLMNPPDYDNKFILTNPPYLARNKIEDKEVFDKYKANDLYKCFIVSIINSNPSGGIIIIPLIFWSSIRKNDIELRKRFLDKFKIVHLNIFEERVFDDTSYTVCSFQFKLKKKPIENKLKISFYPSEKNIEAVMDESNNYIIGGHVYLMEPSTKGLPNFLASNLPACNLC